MMENIFVEKVKRKWMDHVLIKKIKKEKEGFKGGLSRRGKCICGWGKKK